MSRFLISCGGTGGHLSPGIAIAESLLDRGQGCLLVISRKQVDARLIENYQHLDFVKAPGAPFSLHPVRFLSFVIQQLWLLIFSFRFVRKYRPDVIIAFGGFISTGFAIAGIGRRCPLALHETNRKAGKATRFLSGLANRIYLPEGVRLGGVTPEKVLHLSYPLRSDIRRSTREAAREKLGIDIEGKLVVVLGGSQGAQILNEWVLENFESLAAEGINVYCVTGIGKGYECVQEFTNAKGGEFRAYFTPFTDQMSEVLSSADLVAGRAGSGTIAELVHCRVPSILIPLLHAAENHQLANARFLERQGGCIVLEQGRLEKLRSEILDVIFNDWLLGKFRQNLKLLERGDSAERIASDLVDLSLQSDEQMRSRNRRVENTV